MRIKNVIAALSLFIKYLAAVFIVPLLVAVYYRDFHSLLAFAVAVMVMFLFGILLNSNDDRIGLVDDFKKQEALATLVINKLRGTFTCVAVKAPGYGDRRKAMLEDLAILTGASVISEELGKSLQDTKPEDLGSAHQIVVTKDSTTIVQGGGDAQKIKERVEAIKVQIQNTTSDYDREKLQERLAKLAGGVAVI